ncbi:hypothetical protein [Nonomuraea sp. NPDC048916]|uniref:hypothetical protein n=1 Tax=Nonomuraea sp. NPDC048916 TaxID=3154232 RepID=UPI0033D5D1FA
MFKTTTLFAASVIAALVAVTPTLASSANATSTTQTAVQSATQTAGQSTAQTSASACRKLQVTGGRIAIRDFPFTNGLIVRAVPRGTILTSCEFVAGNGSNSYPPKCGRRGTSWYKVASGRLTITGSPFGYVAATCVRVL